MTILTVLLFFCVCRMQAQGNYEDVVYLKNGSVIRGLIIEQIPGQSIKIQTHDRSIFVYSMDEVQKMTKEVVIQTEKASENTSVPGKKTAILMDGLKCYQGSTLLSRSTVSIILRASNNAMAYQDWEKGRSNLMASHVLIGLGVPITLLGVAATIGYGVDGAAIPFIIMCASLPVGVGLLTAGCIVFPSAKKTMTRAIDNYNSSLKTSSIRSKVTISFGLTQAMPGFGINISF